MRVRVYEAGGGKTGVGARVAFVDGPSLATAHGQALARRLGAPLTAVVLAPRREDCALRLRVFTPLRELPLSVEAAWCAGAASGEPELVVEMGVTATRVRATAEGWEAALPTPVLGQRAVEDRALVAAALGLTEGDLDAARPVLAGSCGVNVLVVAVGARATLERARLHPDAWQRVMEKARHVGALVVATEGGGREARFLGGPSGLWDGTGCALSLAPWALAQAREGAAGRVGYALRGEAGFGAEVTVAREGDAWAMTGSVGLVSEGEAAG